MSSTGEVVEIALADLAYGPNVRKERVDLDHVNALEPFATSLPPILVRKVKASYEVIDGMHRWQVAKRVGSPTIKAVVIECGDVEAIELAIKANLAHGKPLTIDERKTVATKFLKSNWSNVRIAQACGLSDKTVAALRPRPTSENPRSSTSLGADGRERPANAGVAAAQRRRIAEALAANPDASDREIATIAKVPSHSTVGEVRRESVTRMTLTAVPDVDRTPTVEDIAPSAPSDWREHPSFELSNDAREFCNFMHRWSESTRFDREVEKVIAKCHPSAIEEAIRSARWMAESHKRLADRLDRRQPLQGVQ